MEIKLIEKDQASDFIIERDPYLLNFSEFDLQSRLNTTNRVSLEDLLQHLSQQTLDWTEPEKAKIQDICSHLQKMYLKFSQYLPESVSFVKTTGRDESEAAYTRKNQIFLPQMMIKWPLIPLTEMVAHELFHIISRYSPEFTAEWYEKLGFTACPELKIPQKYKNLTVSNPDTIGKNCYVKVNKKKIVPFLYSERTYEGGYFFKYFRYDFVECEITEKSCNPIIISGDMNFIKTPTHLFELCKEIDPYENQHRLHPEEMLAYSWAIYSIPKEMRQQYQRDYFKKIHDILHHNANFVL